MGTSWIGNHRLEESQEVNVDGAGGAFKINNTAVTATAAELNALAGATATTAQLNLLAGVTAGTTAASKAVTLDSNGVADVFSVTTERVRAWNATGSTISKGDLVSFVGVDATTGLPKIVLADANVADRHAQGAAQADIGTGAAGFVITRGLSPATLNTNSFSAADDPVYLSETAGAVATADETESDERSQIVGYVRVKSATVGQIVYNFGRQRKLGSESLQTGVALANLGTTATVAEIDELDDVSSLAQSTIAVGAEAGGNTITVTVTVKDAAGAAVNEPRRFSAWLSASATTGVPTSATSGGWSATTGTELKAHTAGVYSDFMTNTSGVCAIAIVEAGALGPLYLYVDLGGRALKISGAITFAA